jgi:hypothetical protein
MLREYYPHITLSNVICLCIINRLLRTPTLARMTKGFPDATAFETLPFLVMRSIDSGSILTISDWVIHSSLSNSIICGNEVFIIDFWGSSLIWTVVSKC